MTDFKRIIKRALCVCLAAVIAVSVTVGGANVASAATYDPSAAVAYAAAHWNDGKGECAEFVRDCLRAGGLTSLTSINTSGLMNQIINAGYGERYRLVESSDGKFLMSDNSAILAPGDPIIFYCATCGFYPHLLLCGTGSGGYVTYYAHNNAANNKVLWANVGGSHKYHNNYAFSIHMKNNGYYPVDEYEYATYTVSNAEGSDLRNRPYKEYGYEDTSVSAVDFGAEVVIIGFYENENGVTYARTESGYWIYATDLEKKEDLVSLSISGETKPTAIEEGSSFGLKGTVTSKSSNISALTAGVYTPDGAVVTEKTVDPASTVASLSLVDAYISFGKLSVGSYVYKVTAKNAISEATLVDQAFTVYKSGEVTVTFDANGGQCDTTSLDITSGETVSALPTPTREGFDFLGWFDENGGEFTAETAVTADITVTAKWTSESSGGETDQPTAAFSLSSDVNYPPKYHIANTSYKLYGTITSLCGNMTTVKGGIFDTDGKMIYGTTVSVNATTFNISQIDNYIAFRNLGVGKYYYRITATNDCGTYDVINYFFNAVTEVPTFFTVTFDANGGQCDTTSLEIISGEKVSALPTPVREGFDFLGWFDENGGEFTAETAVTADITVTAKWTSESSGGETDQPTAAFSLSSDVNYPPKYHIANTSYKLYGTITSLCGNMTTVKGGIFDTDGKMIYGTTVSVNATTFNISQIDNYIAFRNLGVGKYYYRITATNDCGTYDVINYFFNAVTEVPTFFTVTFDANGGQCDTTSLEIISGEKVSALPTPVREGFDFLGWFDENGGEFTAETAVTADITVTAKWEVAQPPLDDLSWEIESYLYARYRGRRVSLHNVPYTLYHDYETEVALLNGEVVVIGRTTNYYGEKWLLTEEGDWVKESDVTKIEDLMPFILSDDVNYPEKLHLSYTSCKLYGTVTSLSGDIKTVNGGIFDADGNRVYGTTVTVDAPTFNISKIDDYIAFRSLGAGEYYYRVIAENNCGTYNVINYAFTVVDEYPAEVTITFKDESLSNVSSELTVARGNTVDELPTPTKSGYIFEGWVDEDGKVITAATAVTYNMTAIPVWVRRIGDVNFDDATDAADVILLEQFILGLIDESEIPDVNGDGIVDSADTVVIQMAVLGFN